MRKKILITSLVLISAATPVKAQYNYLPGSDASNFLRALNNILKENNNPLLSSPDNDKLEYARNYCVYRQNGYTDAQDSKEIVSRLRNTRDLTEEDRKNLIDFHATVTTGATVFLCPQYKDKD